MNTPNNIFTVDVEEYYQAENVWSSLSEEQREHMPDRIEIGTRKILDLLAESGNKATFFVLGCLAEKNQSLIREISARGHEVASHGFSHKPLDRHTPETFDKDVERSIKELSSITGQKVEGYRAPSFSLLKETTWCFEVLKKHGIKYDSSVSSSFFRSSLKCSGEAGGLCEITGGLLELSVSSFLNIPAGGGYFRALPYWVTKACLNGKETSPSLFYIHPWELDDEQPRVKMDPIKTLRHYINLGKTEEKLKKLLSEMKFTSVSEYLHRQEAP